MISRENTFSPELYLEPLLKSHFGMDENRGKGGGVDVEMEGLPLFLLLYSSIIFTVCVCGESKVPFITFRIFSLLS